jgi:Brp/Blh family beta-carotene 15,15'-monooxygenase
MSMPMNSSLGLVEHMMRDLLGGGPVALAAQYHLDGGGSSARAILALDAAAALQLGDAAATFCACAVELLPTSHAKKTIQTDPLPAIGHVFTRIQTPTDHVFRALQRGTSPHPGLDGPATRFMDRVFPQVLQPMPERGPDLCESLSRNAPADRLERFLSGATHAIDRLSVMTSLPTLPLVLLAPLVAIPGLPHGALDLPIAEALWPLDGWRGKLRFAAIYLGLALGVIGLWMLVPGIALVAFLAYSVVHFSGDWAKAVSPLRWTFGVATIGAPALFHPEQVTTLFAYLAPPGAATFSAQATAIAGAIGLCVFIGSLIPKPATRGKAATGQALLWGIGALLPPLVFFAVNFCSLHSIRHFGATIQSLPRTRRALGIAAFLSGLVIVAAVVFVQNQTGGISNPLPKDIVQVIFIGLAALTVPHIILIERFNQLGLLQQRHRRF